MSNLKNLLLRIKTVKSTQKITKVMKMIAASKLKMAQNAVHSAIKFESCSLECISKVDCKDFFLHFEESIRMSEELIVIISSNRGLCGGYNYNVIKKFNHYVKQRKDFKVFFIGSKAYEILHKSFAEHVVGHVKNDKLSLSKIKDMFDEFIGMSFSKVTVFYTHFEGSFLLVPLCERLWPFITFDEYLKIHLNDTEYHLEPDPLSLMKDAAYNYGFAKFYRMLKDSIASEHMSRMIAMDNASNNAGEVIDSLNILYNRSRQAKVTNELIEIISGMEAP